jgi:hypothetical protein
MPNKEFILSVVLTVIVVIVIAYWGPAPGGDQTKKVELALAYAMLVLLFLFGFFVIAAIASGKIDIRLLLAETGEKDGMGKASMSRFQLLIFTFVIGISFFLVVLCDCKKLPEVPNGVLTLLGISASTYGVSKGIHASSTDKNKPDGAPQGPAGQ